MARSLFFVASIPGADLLVVICSESVDLVDFVFDSYSDRIWLICYSIIISIHMRLYPDSPEL